MLLNEHKRLAERLSLRLPSLQINFLPNDIIFPLSQIKQIVYKILYSTKGEKRLTKKKFRNIVNKEKQN